MNVDNGIPLVKRHFFDQCRPNDSCIVHEAIYLSESGQRRFDGPADEGGVRDTSSQGQKAAFVRRSRQISKTVGIQIDADYIRAEPQCELHRCPPYALRRTSDDHRAALKCYQIFHLQILCYTALTEAGPGLPGMTSAIPADKASTPGSRTLERNAIMDPVR